MVMHMRTTLNIDDELLDRATELSGLGWIDVHLLASARLMDHRLWTRDRRLTTAANHLGIGA